jgi:transcriptional regulator with XRE-family HTH domain
VAAGLTADDVAQRAGLHVDHFRRIERGGQEDLRLSTLVKITQAIGVRLVDLVADVDEVRSRHEVVRLSPQDREDDPDYWEDVP